MKKYLLLAFCLLSFVHLHAQTFSHSWSSGHIHVTVTDSLYQDSTYCEAYSSPSYAITIDSSYMGDVINIVDTADGILVEGSPYINTTGVSPWTITTGYIEGWGTGDQIVTAGGGYYYSNNSVTKLTTPVDTLRYISYRDSIWVLPCLYGTVTGTIYIDNNSNCIYDAGDNPLVITYPDLLENVSSPPGTLNDFGLGAYTYLGLYTENIQKSWMINYTVSLPPAYAFIFPMSPCFSSTYTFTTLPQTGVDFPLQCTSNVDVQCYALSPGRVRLHTPFFMHPYVSNTGCDTISGTMTLVKDHRAAYNAALSTHPADIVLGDTLIWNYAPLTSISSGAYWNSFLSDIYLTPDSTLTAGDTLCFRVYTNIPTTDVNPYNNDYTICLPVVYSYDPNSKEISPAGTGPDGQLPSNTNVLTYTINFQNTGTDVADEVKIIDTLDSHIDPKSLKILGTSHNMAPNWLASNVVEFDYPDIMLPDSTSNEPKSHGQVQFSVALKPGVPVGTHIKNTGYIYFDLNPAVVTNTTYNTTSAPSAVPQIAITKNMKVYPNPATDQLIIENLSTGDISILNMSGSVLITQHVVSNKTTIDISNLPTGVYMLRTLNEANTSTTKFTKY